MSGGNGNNEWTDLFASFHARHRDSAGKKLRFTAIFNTAIESLMANSEAPLEWRVLALIWRMSWGHNSDYAVDAIGGNRIGQTVCAGALRVDKRRVSDAVVLLRGMGYLLPGNGQALYPSDCLPSADTSAEPVSKVRALADFSAFLDLWKVQAPADFQELESAEAAVKRLKILRLGLYRKWKRERTKGGPSLYTTPTTQPDKEASSNAGLVFGSSNMRAEEEDPYSTFKRLYPARMFDEPKTRPAFEALTPGQQRNCVERLHVYLRCERWQDRKGQWVPLASNWLKSYECAPPPYSTNRTNRKNRPNPSNVRQTSLALFGAEGLRRERLRILRRNWLDSRRAPGSRQLRQGLRLSQGTESGIRAWTNDPHAGNRGARGRRLV